MERIPRKMKELAIRGKWPSGIIITGGCGEKVKQYLPRSREFQKVPK